MIIELCFISDISKWKIGFSPIVFLRMFAEDMIKSVKVSIR